MTRIANTNSKEPRWHTSKIDPDIRYLVAPLKNIERVEIGNYAPTIRPVGAAREGIVNDVTWIATMVFRAGLKGTEGILDPDNENKELEFKFHEYKLSKRVTLELCQRELYDKIPAGLLAEIMIIIGEKNSITESEADEINFTSSS